MNLGDLGLIQSTIRNEFQRNYESIETSYAEQLGNKIRTSVFTATTNGTNVITHNLPYNSTYDDLKVFYSGILLVKGSNYTENANNTSITLLDWTINSNDTIDFILYKSVK